MGGKLPQHEQVWTVKTHFLIHHANTIAFIFQHSFCNGKLYIVVTIIPNRGMMVSTRNELSCKVFQYSVKAWAWAHYLRQFLPIR